MEMFGQIILGLATGIIFGTALEKSRVFEPGVIVGQMQLRNFLMLKIFLAAVIAGLFILAAMNGFFDVKLHPKALEWKANIVGGLILGAGITLAGACPGTTLAQIGAGYRDAWFTLAGGIAGAMAYGYLEPAIKPALAVGGGKETFASLINVPFWALAIAVAIAMAAFVYALELLRPWRDEVGEDVDGLVTAKPSTLNKNNTASPANA